MPFAFSKPTLKSYSKLIDPASVNLELIAKILSDQDIEYEIDGAEIQVTRGLAFDVFISIEDDKNLIKLRTYVRLNDDILASQLEDIVVELNRETVPLKFTDIYYKNKIPPHGYINGDYYFYYQFGLTPESILYLIRFFSLAFSRAVKSVNKNKKISKALSQG